MTDNVELKKVYDYFMLKGYNNLYYISRSELGLDMSADIGDYVHPNDKGMYRYAEVYTAKITEILNDKESAVKKVNAASLRITPNPNKGSFSVTIPDSFRQQSKVEIFNLEGKSVYSKTVSSQTEILHLEGLNLSGGNYVLRLNNDKDMLTGNLIVQ